MPPDQRSLSDHRQRSAGEAAAHQRDGRRGLPVDHAADDLRPARGRRRARARDESPQGAGERRRRRRPHDSDPVGSRRDREVRADSESPRDRGRAPSPRPRRHAHALRAAPRVGRRARSPSRGAAHRLRRRRGQPVSRLRDARRHDPAAGAGGCGRPDAGEGDRQLHQGAQQGHPQGDVEDGDLDAAELLRRADLRGHRPRAVLRRQVLHLDAVAHRRRRHRRHRQRSPAAPRPRVSVAAAAGDRPRVGRRIQVAPGRRAASLQPGDGAETPARHAHRPVLGLSRLHQHRQRPEPRARDAARPARLQGRSNPDSP